MTETEIKMKLLVSDEDIENILADAIYGCGYWCNEVEAFDANGNKVEFTGEDMINHGYTFKWHDLEEDGDVWYTTTRDDVVNGIKTAIENGYPSVHVNGNGRRGLKIDFDNYDGESADVILQCACMGKVVYG